MIDPIEQYLREHSSAGQKDSTGAFTISADKALSKMAEFQLPRSSAWLLKMVQAGVAARASSIAVTQMGKSSKITYRGGNFGTLEELTKLATDPHAVVTPAQQHLLIGLRAVTLGQRRPVVSIEDPATGPAYSSFWGADGVCTAEPKGSSFRFPGLAGEEGTFTFHIGASPLTAQNTLLRAKGINRVVADEYREMMANAVVSPVSLTVDSRVVNHFGLDDVSFQCSPLVFGGLPAQPFEASIPLSTTVLPEGVKELSYKYAWTVYATNLPRSSEVCWVKDGVICQTDPLPQARSSFFVRLFLSAQDLETDLTGLQPRFEDPTEPLQRIREGLQAFADCAPAIAASEAHTFRAKLPNGRSTSWWGAAALAVGGAFFTPVTLLGAGISLLGLVGMGSANRQSREHQEVQIRRAFPHWAQQLASSYRG